jgi:hypothetical protein
MDAHSQRSPVLTKAAVKSAGTASIDPMVGRLCPTAYNAAFSPRSSARPGLQSPIPDHGAAAFCHNPAHLSQRVMRAVSKIRLYPARRNSPPASPEFARRSAHPETDRRIYSLTKPASDKIRLLYRLGSDSRFDRRIRQSNRSRPSRLHGLHGHLACLPHRPGLARSILFQASREAATP